MSKGRKPGTPHTEETRRKISAALTGRKRKPFSPETIEKFRLVQRGNQNSKGHVKSAECRKRISEACIIGKARAKAARLAAAAAAIA